MSGNREEAQGCLGVLLGLFGIKVSGESRQGESRQGEAVDEAPAALNEPLPYALRDDFLSPAEYSFLRVLSHAIAGRAAICPKVNLADVFFVARSAQANRFRSMIDRKHVDFLLCDLTTMRPLCGIELDDASHRRDDRQQRDEFVNRVFQTAGLPLVRIPVRTGYVPAELYAALAPYLTPTPTAPAAPALPPQPVAATPPTANPAAPVCPKCGGMMVQRVASRGPNPGTFWGCSNYPRCRHTA